MGRTFRFPRRVLVDFDGTVGEFVFPEVPARPFPGFVSALKTLKRLGFEVVIFTTRAWPGWAKVYGRGPYLRYRRAMMRWLKRWGVPYDRVTHEKLPALYLVDDRSLNPARDGGWEGVVKAIVSGSKRDDYGTRQWDVQHDTGSRGGRDAT